MDDTFYIKLYLLIDGISPFVLRLPKFLELEDYLDICIEYYEKELYDNRPPGKIELHKIINFKNGDKLFKFIRIIGISTKSSFF